MKGRLHSPEQIVRRLRGRTEVHTLTLGMGNVWD